ILLPPLWIPSLPLGDLDGDGSLDVIVVRSPAGDGYLSIGRARDDIELNAISLREGKRLWTRRFPLAHRRNQLLLAVGDLDGHRGAEVPVAHAAAGDNDRKGRAVSELDALDGPDGRVLWTWRGRARHGMDVLGLWLARVEGGRRQVPCVAMGDAQQWLRFLRLDARGGETAVQEPPSHDARILEAADLDGDGNDELLLSA